MRTSLIVLLTSFLGVGIFSCGEDLSTNIVNTEENPNIYQPMPSYPEADGLMGTVQFLYSPTAFPSSSPIVMKTGFAQFADFSLPIPGLDSLGDVGSVTVNGIGLRKFRYDSAFVYSSFSHRHPAVLTSVSFDSTAHVFEISGSTNTPAFTLPVTSPFDFAVAQPIRNGLVDRDSGLYVEWGGGSPMSRNKIMLRVTSPDTSYSVQNLPDAGFYRISRNALALFPSEITLDVIKYRDTTVALNGRQYTAFSQIVKTIPVRLF